jgi:hypothetical protein
MNVDQQGIRIDPAGKSREVEGWRTQTGDGMNPVNDRPTNRGDGHTDR